MSLTVVNAELVRELLPMDECIAAMEPAMIAASTGTVVIPPRLISPLIDNSGYFGLMPGSSAGIAAYGAKVVSPSPTPAESCPPSRGLSPCLITTRALPLLLLKALK